MAEHKDSSNGLQLGQSEKNKMHDIKKLKEMIDVISDLEDDRINLKVCLLHIGKLAGRITVNGDIWKEFGHMPHGRKSNKVGIPFDKLFHLANALNDLQIYSLVSGQELGQLKGDMGHLKEIITRILYCIDANMTETDSSMDVSISNIINLSDKYFEMLTAKLIDREISIWDKINFSMKDDRYFVARLLCKIGEYLNDFIKGMGIEKIGKSKRDFVLKAFKNLVEIRNRIVHGSDLVAEGVSVLNDGISEMLASVRGHLKAVFCEDPQVHGQSLINYEYENARSFEEDSSKLLKYWSWKLNSIEDCKLRLNKLIVEAREILREDERRIQGDKEVDMKTEKKQRNKLKNKLENINRQYQLHLIDLVGIGVSDYPKVINMETKSEIIKKWEILQRNTDAKGCEEISNNAKEPKNDYKNLLIREVEYLQSMLELSQVEKLNYLYSSLMHSHRLIAINHLPDAFKTYGEERLEKPKEVNEQGKDVLLKKEINDSYFSIQNALKEWNEKSHIKYEQLDKEFKEKYPDFYDEWQKNQDEYNCKEFQQKVDGVYQEMFESLIQEKDLEVRSVIEYVSDELKLLLCDYVEKELIKFLELKKHEYITQQSVLHLQQYLIDSENLNIKPDSAGQEDTERIIFSFKKYAASQYMKKERQTCRGYRSSGLGHRMISFDRAIFFNDTIGDTLNFSDYLNCFHRVLKARNLSTVNELYEMSKALFKIYSLEESLIYLQKTLERAKSHPEEIILHEWDQYYLKIFAKPRMICGIHKYILDNYTISLRYEEMHQMVEEIIESINMEELDKCNIPEIKRHASRYYFLKGQYFLTHRNDYRQALESFERADRIYEEVHNKSHIANCYYSMKDYNKAKEICQSILDSDEDAAGKATATTLLFLCSSNDPSATDSTDASNYLDQMESCFASDRHYFKNHLQDNYYVMDLVVLLGRLDVMLRENYEHGMSEDRIKKLIEADEKFCQIKKYLTDESITKCMIAQFYLFLCMCYSQVYNIRNSIWKKDGKYLEKARLYFISALDYLEVMLHSQSFDALSMYGKCADCLILAYLNYITIHSNQIDVGFLIDLVTEVEKTKAELITTLFCIMRNSFEQRIEQMGIEDDVSRVDCDILSAYWVKVVTVAEGDLRRLRSWLYFYYKLSNLPSSNVQKERLRQQKCDVREFLVNLTKVFVDILNPRESSGKPVSYSVQYCHNKWGIKITYQNEKLQWKHEKNLSDQDLRNSIKQELSLIGELLVIYIFVMGYFK